MTGLLGDESPDAPFRIFPSSAGEMCCGRIIPAMKWILKGKSDRVFGGMGMIDDAMKGERQTMDPAKENTRPYGSACSAIIVRRRSNLSNGNQHVPSSQPSCAYTVSLCCRLSNIHDWHHPFSFATSKSKVVIQNSPIDNINPFCPSRMTSTHQPLPALPARSSRARNLPHHIDRRQKSKPDHKPPSISVRTTPASKQDNHPVKSAKPTQAVPFLPRHGVSHALTIFGTLQHPSPTRITVTKY